MLASVSLLVPVLLAATPARVELVFGGDIIPHGEVKRSAREHTRYPPEWDAAKAPKGAVPPASLNNDGWDPLLEPIAQQLRAVDVAVVNLETPVTDNAQAVTRQMLFNAPSSLVRGLAAAGVKVVSTANNHALDQHPPGLVETLRHLDATGIQHTGTGATRDAAWEPVFLEVKGMKLGFLSMTRWLNGYTNPKKAEEPHVAFVPYELAKDPSGVSVDEALERVRAAAAKCEALIVMIHWGVEYAPAPSPEDVKLGRDLLEAGAAAVIGHHPHVLQPLESVSTSAGRQGLVVYSLGNLVANQSRFYRYVPGNEGKDGDTRDSFLVRVSLVRREEGGAVELGDVSVVPVWIENNAVGRSAGEPRRILPVLVDRELAAVSEQLAAVETRAAEEAAAKVQAEAQATKPPDAKAWRALSAEERKALQERMREEKKARAERVKRERELRREKVALELKLGLVKLRRERILRMVPSGIEVAALEAPRPPEVAPAPPAPPAP
ncbi:CapA family protein [Myxococcaceae bacterium GXIMD 01537]